MADAPKIKKGTLNKDIQQVQQKSMQAADNKANK